MTDTQIETSDAWRAAQVRRQDERFRERMFAAFQNGEERIPNQYDYCDLDRQS